MTPHERLRRRVAREAIAWHHARRRVAAAMTAAEFDRLAIHGLTRDERRCEDRLERAVQALIAAGDE